MPGGPSCSTSVLKVLNYNVCSAVRSGRLEQICNVTKSHVLFLTGLRWKVLPDRPYQLVRLRNHWGIVFGWKTGPFTNKCAGCGVFFDRRFRPKDIVKVDHCANAMGRAGLVRLVNGRCDLSCMPTYSPPPPSKGSTMQAVVKGTKIVYDWLQTKVDQVPARSLPIIAGDFNTEVGLCPDGVPWEHGTGSFNLGKGSVAGQALASWIDSAEHYSTGRALAVIDTFFPQAGPTFFGDQGCSAIDHFILPHAWLCKVRDVFVAWKYGRTLQLIPDNKTRDHVPIIMIIEYVLEFSVAPSDSPRWCREKLAKCLQYGVGRIEFLRDLVAAYETHKHEFVACRDDPAPDSHWSIWMEVLTEVGLKHFSADRKPYQDDFYLDLHKQRIQLLGELGRVRTSLSRRRIMPPRDTWTWQHFKLHQIQKQLRSLRRVSCAHHRQCLLNDLAAARASNMKAEVQKLCRLIAGTLIGVQKRKLFHVPSTKPSTDELVTSATAPATTGGLSGTIVNYLEESIKFIEDFPDLPPVDMNIKKLAKDDLFWTIRRMQRGPKRKASPSWSCPTELILCAVAPHHCSVRYDVKSGVGAEQLGDDISKFCEFKAELFQIHVHVLRCEHTPCIGNLSRGFFVDKSNGLPGLQGQRLLHLYCSYWRNYFGAVLARGIRNTTHNWPHWFHGYLPGRRREGAMLTQRAIQWKSDFAGLSTLNDLRDMKNAFACTVPHVRSETVRELIEPTHVNIFMNRVQNSAVELVAHDDKVVCVVPQTGNVIGSAEGPIFFSCSFQESLTAWVNDIDEIVAPILVRHPAGTMCRGDIVCFADDTFAKRVVSQFRDIDEIGEFMARDDSIFNEHMSRGGWIQNKAKRDIVPCLRPRVRNKQLVPIAKQHGCHGAIVPRARHLGGQFIWNGACTQELNLRLRACTVGFKELGSFWHSTASFNIKRLLFIGKVFEPAIAGLTSYALSPAQYGKLDTKICKYLRVLMKGRAHCVRIDGSHVQMSNLDLLRK